MSNISKQIQSLLRNAEKTQYQVAKESGITASTLTAVYNDENWGKQIQTAEKALKAIGYEIKIKKRSKTPATSQ